MNANSHGYFVNALQHELDRCRLFGRNAVLLMVRDCGPNARQLLDRSRYLKRGIRPVGLLAFYSEYIAEILLPESDLLPDAVSVNCHGQVVRLELWGAPRYGIKFFGLCQLYRHHIRDLLG